MNPVSSRRVPSSAAGVQLQVVPEGFDARKDKAPDVEAVTDAEGRFEVRARPGEKFNVYAVHRGLGLKMFIPGLKLAKSGRHQAGDSRLSQPGSIRLALPGRARAGDYVYLSGLPLAAAVDSAGLASGYLQVDSVPVGRIEKVVLSTGSDTAGLGSDVAVAARRVTGDPRGAQRGLDQGGSGLPGSRLPPADPGARLTRDPLDPRACRG